MIRSGRQPVQYDSQASVNSDVISASASTHFFSAFGRNKSGATLYLMFFDDALVPINGTAPAWLPVPVPAGSVASIDLTQHAYGAQPAILAPIMTNGLSWAASTTPDTLTVDTSNSMWVTARYG